MCYVDIELSENSNRIFTWKHIECNEHIQKAKL